MNKDQIQILILAGGKGTRISKELSEIPKPMAPINGTPFLELLIKKIKKAGFTHISLLVGHKSEIFENFVKNHQDIELIKEANPLGTGGTIKNAIQNSKFKNFLIFNGDTYFDTDLNLFFENSSHELLSVALHYNQDCERYGSVHIEKNLAITSFKEKHSGDGLINAGIYFTTKEILNHLPKSDSFSFEKDFLENIYMETRINGVPCGGKFIDIGTPESLKEASEKIPEWIKTPKIPTLFLDRDGIIIHDKQYVSKIEDVEFFPAIVPIIKWAKNKNWHVVVLTNQSGIARNLFTEKEYLDVKEHINEHFEKHDCSVDAWYHCPYHATKGVGDLKKDSLLRKPNPGMAILAGNDFPIDYKKSIMIGDNSSDELILPGLTTYLIKGVHDLSKTNENEKIKIFQSHKELIDYLSPRK